MCDTRTDASHRDLTAGVRTLWHNIKGFGESVLASVLNMDKQLLGFTYTA